MTTIQQLWNGEIYPYEAPMPQTEQTKELNDLIQRLSAKLDDCLDDNAKDLFEKYVQAQHELQYYVSEQIFTEGFSLGVKLTAEALIK